MEGKFQRAHNTIPLHKSNRCTDEQEHAWNQNQSTRTVREGVGCEPNRGGYVGGKLGQSGAVACSPMGARACHAGGIRSGSAASMAAARAEDFGGGGARRWRGRRAASATAKGMVTDAERRRGERRGEDKRRGRSGMFVTGRGDFGEMQHAVDLRRQQR
jgi:hypothetical protein